LVYIDLGLVLNSLPKGRPLGFFFGEDNYSVRGVVLLMHTKIIAIASANSLEHFVCMLQWVRFLTDI